MIKDKVMEIQSLALDIQFNTDYAIWFDLSGHINALSIRMSTTKKDYENVFFKADYIFLDYSSAEQKLNKVIDFLKGVLEGTIIPEIIGEEEIIKKIIPKINKVVI